MLRSVAALLFLSVVPGAAAAQVSIGINRVLQVGAVGTPAQNCAALRATLQSITSTTVEKRYVVRLEPGIYDCGGQTVQLKPYLRLEGSGREVTSVVGVIDDENFGVINLADRSSLANLSVDNLEDVGSFGISAVSAFELFFGSADGKVEDAVIEGAALRSGSVGPGDFFALSVPKGKVEVRRSHLTGIDAAINAGATATVKVYSSDLSGGVIGAGTVTCWYSTHNSGLGTIGSNCV